MEIIFYFYNLPDRRFRLRFLFSSMASYFSSSRLCFFAWKEDFTMWMQNGNGFNGVLYLLHAAWFSSGQLTIIICYAQENFWQFSSRYLRWSLGTVFRVQTTYLKLLFCCFGGVYLHQPLPAAHISVSCRVNGLTVHLIWLCWLYCNTGNVLLFHLFAAPCSVM